MILSAIVYAWSRHKGCVQLKSPHRLQWLSVGGHGFCRRYLAQKYAPSPLLVTAHEQDYGMFMNLSWAGSFAYLYLKHALRTAIKLLTF